jgi:DNA-binding response OmpR family regulator
MILLVEDEAELLATIEHGLGRQGLALDTATDGLTGLRKALNPTTELVVLDLALAQTSGLAILRHLRAARPELPVIGLIDADDIADRLAGLEAGAVDTMVKPVGLDELGARIRAQLRLTTRGSVALEAGGIYADLISRQVRVADCDLRLSNTEFELLSYLMRREGTVLPRRQILRDVWGYHHDPATNVLEVYIGYLRRKLGSAGAGNPIETIRSQGYRFTAATSALSR